jgi:hypothetical protein
LLPLQLLLRSFSLSFFFEPTSEALYREGVGNELGMMAGIALALMAFGAIGVWEFSKHSAARATAVAVVAITLGLGVTAIGHVQAKGALSPFGAELEAIDEFVPPPGARVVITNKLASTTPEVTRIWEVAGTKDEVCEPSEAAFRLWVGPGEEVEKPLSCFLTSHRDGDYTEMSVTIPTVQRGIVLLSLRVRRG